MTNGTLIFCPASYKLVPETATDEMQRTGAAAIEREYNESDWEEAKDMAECLNQNHIYSAMLSAAPPQPKGLDRIAIAKIIAPYHWCYFEKEPDDDVGRVIAENEKLLRAVALAKADAILAAAKGEK